VNNDVQRNLMTFIASCFFAAMLVGTASAHSPRETAKDTKRTLEAKTSQGVSEDTDSDVPADDDLNSLKQEHPSSLADYAYSEVPPDKKPADIVLNSLRDNHPDRIAWKSMCAIDEGKEKGENWCKRAILENTLPEIKRIWKSVDNVTSGVFLNMWQNQVDHFYAH